ncbi:MAG: glycosyltransferase family 4 protein [Elusimicrobia bacterium]|nr:glycosyltransferase family 4 protein [Elusimicrobiota bacterium]
MHILFLTDNFPPEVNAPASRTFEHCREWVRAGHRVTVITGFPNFPQGRVYPGYRNQLRHREQMEGISVIRVWTYITANEGFLKRTLDYLSYMFSAILASPLAGRCDVVVGTSPQFFTACAAYFVSRAKCAPFVFELRDIWPESIKAVGAMKDGPALRLLERLELFLYHRAAAIVSVTHSFKETLIKRGVEGGKIAVVTSGVDLSRFAPTPKDPELLARFGLEGKFVVGYIGTHGMAHALETILEAAELIRRRPHGDRFRFLMVGDGARKEALKARARARGLDTVLFLDSVAKDEVVAYWSLLDVSVVHLRKTPLFKTVIPSKIFESMAMGVPVLMGVEGESREIVLREKAGVAFEPENAADLVSLIDKLSSDSARYQELKAQCVCAAVKFDRRSLAADMLGVLQDAILKRT